MHGSLWQVTCRLSFEDYPNILKGEGCINYLYRAHRSAPLLAKKSLSFQNCSTNENIRIVFGLHSKIDPAYSAFSNLKSKHIGEFWSHFKNALQTAMNKSKKGQIFECTYMGSSSIARKFPYSPRKVCIIFYNYREIRLQETCPINTRKSALLWGKCRRNFVIYS